MRSILSIRAAMGCHAEFATPKGPLPVEIALWAIYEEDNSVATGGLIWCQGRQELVFADQEPGFVGLAGQHVCVPSRIGADSRGLVMRPGDSPFYDPEPGARPRFPATPPRPPSRP